jgi:hypothetical protein
MQDFAFWLGTELMGERVASMVVPGMMPGFDAHDPVQMSLMREIGTGFIPANLRSVGRANDIANYGPLGIESWPLEDGSGRSSLEACVIAAARRLLPPDRKGNEHRYSLAVAHVLGECACQVAFLELNGDEDVGRRERCE